MHRADAYAVLARELQTWQQRPYNQVAALVDQPPSETLVQVGQETVTIRASIRWANRKKGTVRVELTADGPSCWRLERLEESIVITPDLPTAENQRYQ